MEHKPEQKAEQTGKSQWPAWFPYPSSWLRTCALILWMAIVLRIAGFWGFFAGLFVSALADDPGPLLKFLGIALLVSALVFSYIHHVLFGNSPSRMAKRVAQPQKLVGRVLRPDCDAALLSSNYHNFCTVFTARQLLLSKPQTAKLLHANAANGVR